MTANEAFAPILDSDEKIIEFFKPHKFRFIGLGMIFDAIKSLFIAIFGGVFLGLSFLDGDWYDSETGERINNGNLLPRIIGIVILSFAVLVLLIAIIWRLVKYDKVFFCYTNKRILIRTGFIGADFETLDFDMIGAMNVRVDFFDKFIHPNTGTLIFASAASPMMANGLPGGVSGYMFVNIQNPYDVYKRVKEFVSKNRDGEINS